MRILEKKNNNNNNNNKKIKPTKMPLPLELGVESHKNNSASLRCVYYFV